MLFLAYDTILFMATWHLAGSLHYIEQQLEHHRTRTFQEEYLGLDEFSRLEDGDIIGLTDSGKIFSCFGWIPPQAVKSGPR